MPVTKTVCRICGGGCGLILSFDKSGNLTRVRGDPDHPITKGFACNKGLEAPIMMRGPKRLRHALKRRPDGGHDPIPLETALDEIAERLGEIIATSGPRTIGFFKGTGGHLNTSAVVVREALVAALGTENYFTTATIDQSCHWITMCRMGYWNAGKQPLAGSDVALLIGSNPLVSLGAYQFVNYDPQRRLKAAREAGLKLIVIDPRETETARQSDLFLQPLPGEDPTVLAGLIHVVLANGWHDKAFCAQWVEGLEDLRQAVASFTPDYVEARAGIPKDQLLRAAEIFARDGHRGPAILGTGLSMAPRSNLASHLVESLNVICARFMHEGDVVPNPGVMSAPREFRAQPVASARSWEDGSKTVTGHGKLYAGERPTGVLADQILRPSPEQVRALFINGANLAVSAPDQTRIVDALKSLPLLVTFEHFMTPTAAISDYVIPAKTAFERVDLFLPPAFETYMLDQPYSQYVPPASPVPEDSEIVDEWQVYWGIAKRLGIALDAPGGPIDMENAPTNDEMLALAIGNKGRVSLDQLRAAPNGYMLSETVHVLPAQDGCEARLQLAPEDVVDELAEVANEPIGKLYAGYQYRLISRRMRGVMNSLGIGWETARAPRDRNPVAMHPDDLATLEIEDGSEVELVADHARLTVQVQSDPTLRRGVVSMSHNWGGLPGTHDSRCANTNLLVSTDKFVEKINAMPAMSAIPVNVVPIRI